MESSTHDARPDGHTHRRRRRLPRLLRLVLPPLLILVWLLGAAVGGPYFGQIGRASCRERV